MLEFLSDSFCKKDRRTITCDLQKMKLISRIKLRTFLCVTLPKQKVQHCSSMQRAPHSETILVDVSAIKAPVLVNENRYLSSSGEGRGGKGQKGVSECWVSSWHHKIWGRWIRHGSEEASDILVCRFLAQSKDTWKGSLLHHCGILSKGSTFCSTGSPITILRQLFSSDSPTDFQRSTN